ncbi:CD5 antigen-like [Anomaloglossus baeobatrachus]
MGANMPYLGARLVLCWLSLVRVSSGPPRVGHVIGGAWEVKEDLSRDVRECEYQYQNCFNWYVYIGQPVLYAPVDQFRKPPMSIFSSEFYKIRKNMCKMSQRTEQTVRLMDGRHRCAGRLEILTNNTWSRASSDQWSINETHVVCRELHCGHADGSYIREPTAINNLVYLSGKCQGNETQLSDCSVTGSSIGTSLDNDVEILCSGKELTVRLMDGVDRCAGRLEILTNSTWSRASSDQWGINETHVVCRELHCGLADGSYIRESTAINGHVYLSGKCQGNETQLSDCSVTGSSNGTSLENDVEILCSERKMLRLQNGPSRCAGRVEMYHNGKWGTICDDSWDETDADVVCKQLGCGDALEVKHRAYYGEGTGPIWLDDIECGGTETHIWDCPTSPIGKHDCDHNEDAGVLCSALELYQ